MTERPPTMRRVVFICTGNYYRSRFAEAVFNHHAGREGLPCRAVSRGLAIHLIEGGLSPLAESALRERGIGVEHTGGCRVQLCEEDLAGADLRIALQESEHRPLVVSLFPDWEARIQYWDISDIDRVSPAVALPQIEERVLDLLADLRTGRVDSWPGR